MIPYAICMHGPGPNHNPPEGGGAAVVSRTVRSSSHTLQAISSAGQFRVSPFDTHTWDVIHGNRTPCRVGYRALSRVI